MRAGRVHGTGRPAHNHPFDRAVMATCSNCASADAKQRDRCPACLMWRRRHHGQERPEDVVVKHNIRRHEHNQR